MWHINVLTGLLMIILLIAFVFESTQTKAFNILEQKNTLLQTQKETIAAQSEELKAINDKLHDLSRFKDHFVHMIAHEMKNPLNTIISSSDEINSESEAYVNMAGKQLLRLITNMLEVQKFEEATPILHLDKCNAKALIKQAIQEVSLLAKSKSISLYAEASKNCLIMVDEDTMVRVLVNLLSNAIKYSPSHSKVTITLMLEENKVKFEVTDHGKGIKKDHIQHIFNKFWQADPTKTGIAKSTGLGLTYCKLAVEAQQGTISVQSKEGSGTTFSISMPLESTLQETVVSLNSDDTLNFIEREEADIITSFANRFNKLEIYQVSDLITVLDELEALHLKSKWKDELKNAINYGNGEKYKQLLDVV